MKTSVARYVGLMFGSESRPESWHVHVRVHVHVHAGLHGHGLLTAERGDLLHVALVGQVARGLLENEEVQPHTALSDPTPVGSRGFVSSRLCIQYIQNILNRIEYRPNVLNRIEYRIDEPVLFNSGIEYLFWKSFNSILAIQAPPCTWGGR